jgi:FkbM family methyltransferase
MKTHYLWRAYRARFFRQAGEIRTVLATLRPGDTAVDVGAHKGRYIFWMRRAVGPTGRVVAFEPQPRLAAYLRDAGAALRWGNVAVRQAAVADTAGPATLHVPGARGVSAGASLDSAAYADGSPLHYACETTTLDRELEGVARVRLIKVDAEGHELPVFRGAERLLRSQAPALLFECETRHLRRHTMGDVFAYLDALGYRGSFFAPTALRPLAEFDPAVHQRLGGPGPYCNNFLFLPR